MLMFKGPLKKTSVFGIPPPFIDDVFYECRLIYELCMCSRHLKLLKIRTTWTKSLQHIPTYGPKHLIRKGTILLTLMEFLKHGILKCRFLGHLLFCCFRSTHAINISVIGWFTNSVWIQPLLFSVCLPCQQYYWAYNDKA